MTKELTRQQKENNLLIRRLEKALEALEEIENNTGAAKAIAREAIDAIINAKEV